ncbi:MAG: nucleoside-diphosphate kinase [Gudongella sp.]|nr:nucleoside-diphosphate kinase [Gudongella sp.]
MQKTLIIIKPDGVMRGLIGEVIKRIERKDLKITEAKLIKPSEDLIREHYIEHKDKSFYNELIKFFTSGKAMVLVVEGENAISIMRLMVGETDPLCASPGTIRGDFALSKTQNIVHASDSKESATREIKLWFGEE